LILGAGFIFSVAAPAAAQQQPFQTSATGQIVAQAFCSPTEVCQQAVVSGVATTIGRFTGVLNERVDITNGAYTGTAVFTTSDGSTINTQYSGQSTPPDSNGQVFFFEVHDIVGGTGRFANVDGSLNITGTSDATGKIQVTGVGTLSK
jgi:hypothetical protein